MRTVTHYAGAIKNVNFLPGRGNRLADVATQRKETVCYSFERMTCALVDAVPGCGQHVSTGILNRGYRTVVPAWYRLYGTEIDKCVVGVKLY